jgi:hypothetical protein
VVISGGWRRSEASGFCCILVLVVWLGTNRGITRQRRAARVRQDQDFKGRQFTAEVILWAVRWYLMFPISYRDLELMLLDRGVEGKRCSATLGASWQVRAAVWAPSATA